LAEGLAGLPPAVREAAEPFLNRFEVRRVTLLPSGAPEPESPFGLGEAGYRRWQASNLARQAAEFRARGALPAEPPEPERRAVALCCGKPVEIRRDGTRCEWRNSSSAVRRAVGLSI